MPDIARNDSLSRYEAHVDGELAGFVDYQSTDDTITFTHTEIESKFEGQGIGSALARFALDDVRAGGSQKVVPVCAFIKEWIVRHPDYHSLVPADLLATD